MKCKIHFGSGESCFGEIEATAVKNKDDDGEVIATVTIFRSHPMPGDEADEFDENTKAGFKLDLVSGIYKKPYSRQIKSSA